MDNLTIAATERSPEIDFDFRTGRLSLKGESYPEDASAVFGPIFSALSGFLAETKLDRVSFRIELIYFNSSSAKALMNMFQMLEKKAASGGTIITVDWVFAAEDETMREFGEDFSEDLKAVSFNLAATDAVD